MLLPLRLRLRSSSTREDKKHYPFPNPYSHNPWYKKWGQINADAFDDKYGASYLALIDRIDDSWDGSDAAVITLMALMHACVQLAGSVKCIRPMMFLRENIYERIRAIDPEFSRIETCVVSLDWTKEQLLEMVERRLQLPFNPKPALGSTWDFLFEQAAYGSSYQLVFDFCQHRPRDVVTYCAFAIDVAQSANHQKVSVEDLHAVPVSFRKVG